MDRDLVYREIEEKFGFVPGWVKELPDAAISELWGLDKKLMLGETAIPNKYKALMGLAVVAALHSTECSHALTEFARHYGASDTEIKEALLLAGMASLFSTYLSGSGYDLDTFKKEFSRMLENARLKELVGLPV